jgi:hypothetical protein
MGLLVLGGNGLRHYEARRGAEALRQRSAQLYRAVFDPSRTGGIPDPLGLALSKVAELKGETEPRSLIQVFSQLGEVLVGEENHGSPSMDVTLDVARCSLEGVDFTGSAPNTEAAQSFQRAWAQRASSASLLNIQNAPGVGFRFDLSVRW